jgi:hypothetical protein
VFVFLLIDLIFVWECICRLQEMMQGVTLPSLLMNNRNDKAGTTGTALVHRRCPVPRGIASSRSATSNVGTPIEKGGGNQKTHDLGEAEEDDNEIDSDIEESRTHSIAMRRSNTKKKPNKKKATKMTALEQVQQRKKMFAKWIKEGSTRSKESEATSTIKLPSIHNGNASQPLSYTTCSLSQVQQTPQHDTVGAALEQVHLPSIPSATACVSMDEPDYLKPYDATLSKEAASIAPGVDLEDSLDEDAVNDLLNWTGTLLSPTQIEF